jgi:transposase
MYSNDKIIDALILYHNKHKYNLTIKQILSILHIARSTLYVWINNSTYSPNNNRHILPKRIIRIVHNAPKLTEACENFIINHVHKFPQFNIKKLSKKISKLFHITISRGYIYFILKKNKITHKTVQKYNYPHGHLKFKKEAKRLKIEIDKIDNNFTSIDESGFYLNTYSNRGWSKKGTKCTIKTTFNRSNKYSVVMGISKNKINSYKLIKRSYNALKFNNFIKDDLIPNMENNVLFMDNYSIHKTKQLKEILIENDKMSLFNIPYSPQFNPIEYIFNSIKADIKKNNITTYDKLDKYMKQFVNKTNKIGFGKYFEHTYNNLSNAVY